MNPKDFKTTLFSLIGCLLILSAIPALSAETQPAKAYIIAPEDVLDVQVWGHDDLCRKIEVSKEGDFTFPFIGKVKASGLSILELESSMIAKLADGYLVGPEVSVSVAQYKGHKIFLYGEVKKPGTYVLKGRTSLIELLSEAGGLTENAGSNVLIVRPVSVQQPGTFPTERRKATETMNIDLEQLMAGKKDDNVLVGRGDSVYVSEAPRVFVTGKVEEPGEYKWVKGLTVGQAIILAGGPNEWGSDKRASIVRVEGGIEKEFEVSIADSVMPSDVIKVPSLKLFEHKDVIKGKTPKAPSQALRRWSF